MAVVQSFQNLVQVVFALLRLYHLQKLLVVHGVYMLEYQTVRFALSEINRNLLYDVQQLHCVVLSPQRHQDLDLTVYLLELYCR